MHLPRSVFSHRQLDLFLWLLKVNDIDDVPSVKSMQTLNAMLQRMCGVDSVKYKGELGHIYYVNNLSQIIAQVRHFLTYSRHGSHASAIGNGKSESAATLEILS